MTRHQRLMQATGETSSKKIDSLIRQGWNDSQIIKSYTVPIINNIFHHPV